jgi:pimeloyl-ACP methyl ester carboxylesterase
MTDVGWTNMSVCDGTSTVAASTLGHGPTLMLIHGWGGSAKDMTPLAVAFANAGYRSIVFDMPGHGRSSGRESSLVEFLRAMRAIVRLFGPPDFLVGHSFGGAAAIFGITELALPVRGAVLVSPAPGPAYYVDRFARTLGLPAARTHGMVKRLVQRVGRSLESLDAVSAAQHACVPALIFHDPADREVPFEFSRRMTDAWNGARLVEAPSLGHKRILRAPATIAAAVDFARSLSP